MPARKSNVSVVSTAAEEKSESTPTRVTKEKESKDGLGVEDISLPKSMIARLAKGVLPANTQIQKDALLALHKSATVFVSYIASNANENTLSAGKKTIAPHDVIAALKDAEFEAFIPRLEAELEKYSSTQNNKRNTYRKKVKEEKAAAVVPDGGEGDSSVAEHEHGIEVAANGHLDDHDDDTARPFKKLKAKDGAAIDPDVDDGDDGDSDVEQDDDDDDVEEEAVDDEGSEDEQQDSDEDEDETMGDTVDELEAQTGIRDEALDEPDSD